MTGAIRSNFRGARALLLQPEDGNRDVLARTLQRLGLQVQFAADRGADDAAPDIVFVDADEEFAIHHADVPHVALIGLEAPSRLGRVARLRSAAYLMKPIRPTGVFTALFMAFNEHSARQREALERQQLARRAEGRRIVMKAILHLMRTRALDDDEAYREIRLGSMHARVPIEQFAAELLAASEPTMRTFGNATHGRKNNQP